MRLLRLALLLLLALFAPSHVLAQDTPMTEGGSKSFGSYQFGSYDHVNLLTMRPEVDIPLASIPEPGGAVKLTYGLTYTPFTFAPDVTCPEDTHTHPFICTNEWREQGSGGLNFTNPLDASVDIIPGTGHITLQVGEVSHPMGSITPSGVYLSTDGSGILWDPSSNTIFEANGTKHVLAYESNNLHSDPRSVIDQNGNTWTAVLRYWVANPGPYDYPVVIGWTDPLGRTILDPKMLVSCTPTSNLCGPNIDFSQYRSDLTHCSSTAQSAALWPIPSAGGGTQNIKICFAVLGGTQTSLCAVSSNCTEGSFLTTVITDIVLPSNKKWSFAWDGQSAFYDLLSVSSPGGAVASYQWTNYQLCGSKVKSWTTTTRMITTRAVDSGDGTGVHTWAYSQSYGGNNGLTAFTTVTSPLSDDEVHTFTPLSDFCALYETNVDWYSGSGASRSLMKNRATSYQYDSLPNLAGTDDAPVYNVYPHVVTNTDPSGLTSQAITTYDSTASWAYGVPMSHGSLLRSEEYQFGSGAAGSMIRANNYAYLWQQNNSYLAANMVALVTSMKIVDANNNQVALTTYAYDESNGSPSGVHGNRTSSSRWLGGSSYSPSAQVYNSVGMPTSTTTYNPATGSQNAVTTIAYDASGIFPSQITHPATNGINQVEYMSYDANTGVLNWHTDVNGTSPNDSGHTTTYSYDALNRPVSVTRPPGGGGDTYCYTDLGGSICSAGAAPYSAIHRLSASPSADQTSSATYDGLGKILTATNSAGNTTTNSYDPLGRLSSVTVPIQGSIATTSYVYDSLNRRRFQCQPGGGVSGNCTASNLGNNYVEWSYGADTGIVGLTLTSYDENRNAHTSISDSAGRLIRMVEPGSLNTDYTYDVLDNLETVDQYGVSGEVVRHRSFSYDAASRLITSTNPETGTICYGQWSGGSPGSGTCENGYDANGNLLVKVDARNQPSFYSYDALNRVTSVIHNNSTPNDYYSYDVAPSFMPDNQNVVGRLANISNSSGGGVSPLSSAAAFSYDAMGRITRKWEQTPSRSPSGYFTYGGYDLAGNLIDLMYPDGQQVTNHYDAAGRLDSVRAGTSTNPGSPYMSAIGYSPAGAVQSMTYGNGVIQTLTQNSRLQPCKSTAVSPASQGGGTIYDHRYFYGTDNAIGDECNPVAGNNGNIKHIVDAASGDYSQDFSYDALNRITQWSAPNMGGSYRSQSFNYDSFGNMWQAQGYSSVVGAVGTLSARMFPNPQATWTSGSPSPFTGADQLANNFHDCVPSGVSGTLGQVAVYDAAGNLLCDGSNTDLNARQYTWDSMGRLSQVNAQHNGTIYYKTADYVYNSEGDRARANQYDTSGNLQSWKEYLHFSGQVLAERDQTGLLTDYVYANGERIARIGGQEVVRVHLHGENDSAGRFAAFNFPLQYTIQTGDKLYWRQYEVSAFGGLALNFGSFNTEWNKVDTDGEIVNSDTRQHQWHERQLDLSGMAGLTTTGGWFTADTNTPAGAWDMWFADAVIVRANGGVVPIFTAPTPPALQAWNQGGVSNQTSWLEVNPTPGDNRYATTYYLSDHLGTTQMELTSMGYPVWEGEFAPFGQEVSNLPTAMHYKFTGKERDSESGLDYFGARYYASNMGRWMSPDPINLTNARLTNPANTLNKYIYGGNNPLKYVDRDGKDITFFYDPSGVGHLAAAVLNQDTGASAFFSFGPAPGASGVGMMTGTPGDFHYPLGQFMNDAGGTSSYASLTIQTNPEDAQKLINAIKSVEAGQVPDFTALGTNCTTELEAALRDLGFDYGATTPGQYFATLYRNHSQDVMDNPFKAFFPPQFTPGKEYGNPRSFGMNYSALLWQVYIHRNDQSEPTVTTSQQDSKNGVPIGPPH